MILPQKLYRKPPINGGNFGYVTKAILQHDGIHFVDRLTNIENKIPSYDSIETMNKTLKGLGFDEFEIVNKWPID